MGVDWTVGVVRLFVVGVAWPVCGVVRRLLPTWDARQTVASLRVRPTSMSVLDWRRRRLLDAAFPDRLADELARRRVDLHEILELVDPGCPPDLAAGILSAMDTENRSGTEP